MMASRRRRSRFGTQLELGFGAPRGALQQLPTPSSRANTRRKADGSAAPAPKPWLAAVLAVDTARRSGWALGVCGTHVDSGEVDTFDEQTLELIVDNALERVRFERVRADVLAGDAPRLPLVLVLEAPWGGRPDIVAALGAARERWLRAWRTREQALGRVVYVQPSTWRGPVLGRAWVSASRERVREHERRVAAALVGHFVGPDEAPAILIARWAAHAARVGDAIGKRASDASLRAWTKGKDT